jgi:superfamily II DNA or RNA helicase
MIKDFSRWYEEDLGYLGKGKKVPGPITIAIINTLDKMNDKELEEFGLEWDVVVVDEVHKVSKMEGRYSRVLTKVDSMRRYGLTATLPVKPEAKLLVEGLIGPKIGETKEEDLVKIGVLAKPKIKILKIPKNDRIRSIKKYDDVYEQGVVLNRRRHEIIVEAVKKYIKKKGTALVFVVKINHGAILKDYFSEVYGEENVKLVLGGPPQKLLEESKDMDDKLKKLKRELDKLKLKKKAYIGAQKAEAEKEYRSFYKAYSDFKDQVESIDETAKSYRDMSKEREQYRVDLNDKKYRVAIATTSWKEGINIPSLDVVVNATGYKSAIMNEQLFGRGRRATKKKKEVLLIDCFDSTHPYLIDAFGERISMYCERGWL